METIKVQIMIDRETEIGRYKDALYFTLEEYQTIKEEEIEQLKLERINNWKNSIAENSSKKEEETKIEPTKEELQKMVLDLEDQMNSIRSEITRINLEISSKE